VEEELKATCEAPAGRGVVGVVVPGVVATVVVAAAVVVVVVGLAGLAVDTVFGAVLVVLGDWVVVIGVVVAAAVVVVVVGVEAAPVVEVEAAVEDEVVVGRRMPSGGLVPAGQGVQDEVEPPDVIVTMKRILCTISPSSLTLRSS
jgi:hypothetical protein